ncbi:hypothetical protein ACF0H5_016297 [Mactra antiquata]
MQGWSFSRRTAIKKTSHEKAYGSIEPAATNDRPRSPAPRAVSDGSRTSNDPLPKLQRQVDEVKDILKDNIEKVVERDEKVGVLIDRTETLRNTTTHFKNNAKELKKSTQRRNWKMTCCIIIVVLLVLGIIAIIVLYALKVI